MTRFLVLGGVLVVGVIGTVACGGSGSSTTSQAASKKVLCENLAAFGAALANIEGLVLGNPTANAENLSVKRAQAAWIGVKTAARGVKEANEAAVDSALTGLKSAAQSVPAGATPSQVRQIVGPKVQALYSAWSQMYGRLDCTTGTTTTTTS